MSNLATQFTSGQTVYAIILNAAGQVWNANTSAFETPTAANWSHYAIAMTEQTAGNLTGIYTGSFPTGITTPGVYTIVFRQQSGGSPAATDGSAGMIGGQISWTGSAEGSSSSSSSSGPIQTTNGYTAA
ncbi:MAG TPA: hypothetical protein VGG44_04675 [Tepidisphaeraceae bacterium]